MRFFATWLSVSTICFAQSFTVPTAPVLPGSVITVSATAAPGQSLCPAPYPPVIISAGGDLVAPRYSIYGHVIHCRSSWSFTLQIPASGAGSSGSYAIYYGSPPGFAARLDVGAPSAGFPAIITLPSQLPTGFGGHTVDMGPLYSSFPNTWTFINTSGALHAFGPGDVLRVFSPGGSVPLATLPLTGFTVPAGSRVQVALPLTGLPVAPYTIEVGWLDPLIGPVQRRIGITPFYADLHLPDGKTVPSGGSIEAYMDFLSVSFFTSPGPKTFALLVGYLPGSTTFPNAILPLVPDALTIGSLDGSLGPWLTGTIGTPIAVSQFAYVANGLRIWNPNIPALSGTILRVAGLVYDPSIGVFGATQPEEITLQ